MLVDEDLDKLKKNFFDDVRETMKHNEDVMTKNQFFD